MSSKLATRFVWPVEKLDKPTRHGYNLFRMSRTGNWGFDLTWLDTDGRPVLCLEAWPIPDVEGYPNFWEVKKLISQFHNEIAAIVYKIKFKS